MPRIHMCMDHAQTSTTAAAFRLVADPPADCGSFCGFLLGDGERLARAGLLAPEAGAGAGAAAACFVGEGCVCAGCFKRRASLSSITSAEQDAHTRCHDHVPPPYSPPPPPPPPRAR